MYRHILIPTDGTEVSQRGVDHGLALARALGAKVTIVTVTEPLPNYTGLSGASMGIGTEVFDSYDEQQAAYAEGLLAAAKGKAEAMGLAVNVLHVPNAHAADAIVETAAARDAELIVMASHGRRGLGRLLVGSQTTAVLSHSAIPVLVVR